MNIYHKSFYLFIFLLVLQFSIVSTHAEQNIIYNDYLAGFVIGKNKLGLENATIVITDDKGKISSLRTGENGWFEAYIPLSKNTISDMVNLIVMKRGYKPATIEIIRQHKPNYKTNESREKPSSKIDIHMTPVPNFYIENEEYNQQSNILYGYIYGKKHWRPVRGAIVTVTEKDGKESHLISSTVTRDSGYFTLHYPDEDKYLDKELTLNLEHRDHTSVSDSIQLNKNRKYYEKGMPQIKHFYSIGVGLNLQYTGKTSDYESGASFTLNMTWYPGGLLIQNKDLNKHKKRSGISGYELSVGTIPYLEDKPGPDKFKNIYVYGIGIVFDSINYYSLPIQLRTGLSITETNAVAVYAGINIPFYFF